jgi:hypothetical protein
MSSAMTYYTERKTKVDHSRAKEKPTTPPTGKLAPITPFMSEQDRANLPAL